MRAQYCLAALGNDQLLVAISAIARKGHELTAELLAHLSELGERGLHLDLGFASLFEYCTKALGVCEPTAYRRVTAARVCHQYPEAFARFERGELHLSALCLLKKHLKPENAGELLEACTGKSARQVEELLAARFPKPDVRDSVRRLPTRPVTTFNVESSAVAEGNADTRSVPIQRQPEEAEKTARHGLSAHAPDRPPDEPERGVAACSTPRAPPATRPPPSAVCTSDRREATRAAFSRSLWRSLHGRCRIQSVARTSTGARQPSLAGRRSVDPDETWSRSVRPRTREGTLWHRQETARAQASLDRRSSSQPREPESKSKSKSKSEPEPEPRPSKAELEPRPSKAEPETERESESEHRSVKPETERDPKRETERETEPRPGKSESESELEPEPRS